MRWTGRGNGEMNGTIKRMIVSTIGCLIMDAIFPPHRHGRTGSGDAGTGDEQEKRRGEREGEFALYTIAEERF